MATLRQIIYDVKEIFNSYSDDALLSEEHIAFLINTKRAFYLKQYLSQLKREIPNEAKQKICIDLEEDVNCNDDLVILKSKLKLPPMIEQTGRSNISEVFFLSRTAKWINIIDYQRIPFIKSGRFNNKQIYIAVDPDDYLLVTSLGGGHEFLEEVFLNIVAEDPEQAHEISSCSNAVESCDFWDQEYPVNLDLLELIRKDILNELSSKLRTPVDVINNSEDETVNKNRLANEPRRTK